MPAPELRLLVDVDVVLDVLAQRQPYAEASERVLRAVETGRAAGLLAAHSVTTLYYLLGRHHDRSVAAAAVGDLLQVFSIAPVDADVLRDALRMGWRDFEDAVQMAAALAAKATHVVTRNTADYRQAHLPVLTPAEVAPLIGEEPTP